MKKLTLFSALLFIVALSGAQTNILPEICLTPFSSGFSQPVGVEHAGDSRLFIVEQTGKIRIVDSNGKHKSHFLNISDKISTAGFEQGLLGLTFDPDYSDNGYFYIHYTNLEGNSVIARYSVNPNNPNKALPSSELIMWENDDPFRNHNSGQLAFGPDGYLYFTMGDGGSGGDPFNNAQDLSTQFGKLLRIDPTEDGYDIPATNPYVGMEGIEPEIWASGLRNPWRFSFDLLTGDLWIPDVGQNMWEEVNMTPASSNGGENYGWSCMEASHFFEADCDNNGIPFTAPIAEYAHVEGVYPCSGSITGGFVYRGDKYPDMYGKYFYTDFCTGVIRTTYWDGSAWVTADLGQFSPFAYSTFGQDITGELYLVDKTAGVIYRFQDCGGAPMVARPNEITFIDAANFDFERADTELDQDEVIREAFHQNPFAVTTALAPTDHFALSPNPNHGQFSLQLNAERDELYTVRITDLTGHEILTDKKEVVKGINDWQFHSHSFTSGIYLMQIQTSEGHSTLKFVVE